MTVMEKQKMEKLAEGLGQEVRCIFDGEDPDKDVSSVLDSICFRLVNRDFNRAWLEGMPHRGYLDLAVVYCIVREQEGAVASISITDDIAGKLGLDERKLWELAIENTPRMFPYNSFGIDDFLGIGTEKGSLLYALTTRQMRHGAGAVLYPGVLEEMYGKIGYPFYILPSSIHEVILLPDKEPAGTDVLADLVQSVNDGMVAAREVLSYSVYRYEPDKGMFMAKEVHVEKRETGTEGEEPDESKPY